ncbi:1-phosphatidylinositol 4,5-bisphosphate phosphodiesterase beta-2 [Alosa sapidissima]|uniref:1-phosphatidylinositol 4,5-bisphosphate phosphodiesterase beta-2 n=1 Tax=Alosa sapidissima TaxID=34773 RepID=UPI001C0A00C6|nr:1-phosphatidylinositol 4,5-bisphosphate phosphodiesterase beta-2 [Alosa sapidissima]
MIKKRYFLQEPEVKEYLVKGERFIKWSDDSTRTAPVTLKMDSKGFYLYWTNQSKETEFLDVATIRDTRSGKYAKLPKHPKVRNVLNMDFPDSNHLAKTMTVVSGPDMVNLTYHNFFANKEKVVQNWEADILAMAYNPHRANACRQVFLDKIYVRLTLQTNKDGKIPVKNFYKMFRADKKRVDSALSASGLPKGKFDSVKLEVFTEEKYKEFLSNLCPRPEIYEIFTSYSTKPIMSKEVLTKFLNEKQRDSRLNEELYPPLRPDQVKALMEKYEPMSTNINRGQITPEGLLNYLIGPETSVVVQDKLAQSHDMKQPLNHYFIKSSHNTYLTAGQFSGVSSPEMYRQCLLAGCRCLELDCWKGKPPDEEPIITHGFTMTTEILFKDVIEAIAESAFKTSQYPVILSFENHVDSVKQQEKMANYCRTIFGDALLTDPLDKYPLKPGLPIPSPSELMGKILIKNKKGNTATTTPNAMKTPAPEQASKSAETPPVSAPEPATDPAPETASTPSDLSESAPVSPSADGAVELGSDPTNTTYTSHVGQEADEEEQEQQDEQDEEKMKNSDEGTAGQEVTAYEAMSSIVNYIQPCKFISLEASRRKNKSYNISSFVETKGESLIAKSAVEFVEYNKRQMSRIYPKGTRMDSSNYNPQPFWNAGCQMVALNYQTMDFPMQLNMSLFEFNGRTGYLLKHDLLRRNDKTFDPYCDRLDTIVANTLSIKIYSGQFLSEKSVKTGVEVEIIGLPGDQKRKFRTKWCVTPNSINPVWTDEPFVFEKISFPEMASLRIVAYEEGGKFLGHRIIPVDAIQSGYHHIGLRSESNLPLTLPSLFVYIEVKDYIPAAFADFTDALFNPVKHSDKPSKTQESSAYLCPYELPMATTPEVAKAPPPSTLPVADVEVSKDPEEGAILPPPPEESPVADADATTAAATVESPSSLITEERSPTPPPEPTTEPVTPLISPPDPPILNGPALDSIDIAPTPTPPEPEANIVPVPELPSPDPDMETSDEPPASEAPAAEPLSTGSEGEDRAGDPPSEPAPGAEAAAGEVASATLVTNSSIDLTEPSTVSSEELLQHKSFLKVTKRQEKELKELERKFQKKGEELTQKYSDQFKSLKKKTSLKKKEAGSEQASGEPQMERVLDLKEKMQLELRAQWTEQYHSTRKKKEQHATECLTKLLEMATERHSSELKALHSENKEMRKKTDSKRSGTDKCRLKKSKSVELLDEDVPDNKEAEDCVNAQEEALRKNQAATLETFRSFVGKLVREALDEHGEKMRTLPCDVKVAVNTCIGAHFPKQVEQLADNKPEKVGQYGHVFLG